ncbi:MAG: hypothetical protein GF387_00995 [Candidatus Portnoybacteria bacterium]|nr:hypothetical protein [Candidatus Portnoybacteria bacterium]
MKKTYFPILIIVIILVVGGVYYAVTSWTPEEQTNPPVQKEEISRKEVMSDIAQNISDLSPADPVLGGSWYVTRFWFIEGSNKHLYVSYEDGHIARQILVEAEKENNELKYRVLAYFEPGESTWDLKRGEDKFFGSMLELYEYNEELEEWIKKN